MRRRRSFVSAALSPSSSALTTAQTSSTSTSKYAWTIRLRRPAIWCQGISPCLALNSAGRRRAASPITSKLRTTASMVLSSCTKASRSRPCVYRAMRSIRSSMSSMRTPTGLSDIDKVPLDPHPVSRADGPPRHHVGANAQERLDAVRQLDEPQADGGVDLHEHVTSLSSRWSPRA